MTVAALSTPNSTPTEAFQSPAQALRTRSEGMKVEATAALHSLSARMAALAEEALDLATVENVFPRQVLEGLRQFANNTRSSVNIVQSAPPSVKSV